MAQENVLKGYVLNGMLYVSGLTEGQPWYVYNLNGVLIYQGFATGSTEKWYATSLLGRGVYVVVSGNKSIKVVY
jgi:hypothetical protein